MTRNEFANAIAGTGFYAEVRDSRSKLRDWWQSSPPNKQLQESTMVAYHFALEAIGRLERAQVEAAQ